MFYTIAIHPTSSYVKLTLLTCLYATLVSSVRNTSMYAVMQLARKALGYLPPAATYDKLCLTDTFDGRASILHPFVCYCYVLFPPFNCQAYVCVCVRPHASISVPIHHHKICHIKNSVFQFIRRRFETSNTLQKELFGPSSLVLFVFFLLHQFTMRYFWMKLYMYSCAGVSGREARIGKEM